jgi:uncharacterized membrane protein
MAESIEPLFTAIALGFEAIGALAMVAGFVIALVLAVRALRRTGSGHDAYLVLRNTLGAAILLGLEVLVAADLIRTITSKPSIEDAVILGLIVIIRTVCPSRSRSRSRGTLLATGAADQRRPGARPFDRACTPTRTDEGRAVTD